MTATATRGTVVVADDSRLMRRVLSQTPRATPATTWSGRRRTATTRWQLCRAAQPDVMTLDLAMPGLDGMGVLRTLQRDGLDIPVVVVCAFCPAHGARAVDALAEGAFDLIEKPTVGETLSDFGRQLDEKVFAAAGRSISRRRVGSAGRHRARPRVGARRRGATRTPVRRPCGPAPHVAGPRSW